MGAVWKFLPGSYPPEAKWLAGYEYPINDEAAEMLVGTQVEVNFEYAWDQYPDGRQENFRPTRCTITDKRSSLMVQHNTFVLAADAFIVALKRMRSIE